MFSTRLAESARGNRPCQQRRMSFKRSLSIPAGSILRRDSRRIMLVDAITLVLSVVIAQSSLDYHEARAGTGLSLHRTSPTHAFFFSFLLSRQARTAYLIRIFLPRHFCHLIKSHLSFTIFNEINCIVTSIIITYAEGYNARIDNSDLWRNMYATGSFSMQGAQVKRDPGERRVRERASCSFSERTSARVAARSVSMDDDGRICCNSRQNGIVQPLLTGVWLQIKH